MSATPMYSPSASPSSLLSRSTAPALRSAIFIASPVGGFELSTASTSPSPSSASKVVSTLGGCTVSPLTSNAPSAKASRASQSECALFHSSARSLKTGRRLRPWRSSSSGTSSSTRPAAKPVTTATSSTPTAARFARTRSRIVPLSPSGRSVFGSSRVSGPRRLPGPAASTTAFTSCPGAWDDGSIMAPRPMSAAKAERKRAGSSFVIATRNRPDYLRDAVESLVGQTVLPEELCIVDSSDETPARPDIEALCADAEIRLDYVHPAPRGLTLQRNVGIGRTTGDPVFLIDDDVWLDPDVHEEILAEYERWGRELGGVRG